jgi:hypothetical protein
MLERTQIVLKYLEELRLEVASGRPAHDA